MTRHILVAIRLAAVTLLLTGLAYPLVVTGLVRVAFPGQSEGGLVRIGGTVVGARLIAQPFHDPSYFWPRPSAAGSGHDAAASGGSNLGPTSRVLHDRVQRDVSDLTRGTPSSAIRDVPVDRVTTSASGLDPDITVANAYSQAPRVAAARRLPMEDVRALIDACVIGRQFGLLGEPRLNVLALNLALDGSAWP
jgi:K+-transporting ATPase ATPase C chain